MQRHFKTIFVTTCLGLFGMSHANAFIPWGSNPMPVPDEVIGLNIDTTMVSGKEYAIQLPMVTSSTGNISLSCNLQTVFQTNEEFVAAVNTYIQQYNVYGSHLIANITLDDVHGTCTASDCQTTRSYNFYTQFSVANIKFTQEGAAIVIRNVGALPLRVNNCYLHL